jgi:periplasmic divalent cation tolerance protein
MGDDRYQIVFMTAKNAEEAGKIAEALVNEGLAACVNVVDRCRSVYRWKGETVTDDEALLIAKTKRTNFDAIARRVAELHSYDVPEVIGADLSSISESYREFLDEVLRP